MYEPDRGVQSLKFVLSIYDQSHGRDQPPVASYESTFALPTVHVGEWLHSVDAPGARPSVHWKVQRVEHTFGLVQGDLVWTTRVEIQAMEYLDT